jgi:hypothetical protein
MNLKDRNFERLHLHCLNKLSGLLDESSWNKE